jgi:GNAT superfamily N-acetyltransferase
VHIRYGHVSERSALVELQRRASLVYEETRADLLAHPDAIELPDVQLEDRRVRVAEIASQPVGFSVTLPQTPGAWELDGLFVEPLHWGKGIGRALVLDAMELARHGGVNAIDVIANPRAEDFYKKVGFTGSDHVPTRFGPGIRMRLVVK